jgi:hypothetical protein
VRCKPQTSRVHGQTQRCLSNAYKLLVLSQCVKSFRFSFFSCLLLHPFYFDLTLALHFMPLIPKTISFSQLTAYSAAVTITYFSGLRVIHAETIHPANASSVDYRWSILPFAKPPSRWWEVIDEHSSVSIATDHFQFGF